MHRSPNRATSSAQKVVSTFDFTFQWEATVWVVLSQHGAHHPWYCPSQRSHTSTTLSLLLTSSQRREPGAAEDGAWPVGEIMSKNALYSSSWKVSLDRVATGLDKNQRPGRKKNTPDSRKKEPKLPNQEKLEVDFWRVRLCLDVLPV